MTVAIDTNLSGPYLTNGSTTEFPIAVSYLEVDSYIFVYQTTLATSEIVLLVDGVDYTIDSSDNVVIPGPLATGYRITILRIVPLKQLTDLSNQGGFFPETHEDVFDYLMMAIQQLNEGLARSVKVNPGEDVPEDYLGDAQAAAAAAEAAEAAAEAAQAAAEVAQAAAELAQSIAEAASEGYHTKSATAPTVNEDADSGYQVGHMWYYTVTGDVYFCDDNTVGAAVWTIVISGDAGGGGIGDISEKTDDYTMLDDDDGTLFVLGRATAADKTFDLATLADNLGDTFRAKNISDYLLMVIGESRGTDAVEAGTTTTVVNATAHGFVAGQVLRMTSGDESGEERRILSVVTDAITLDNALSGAPSATETFEVFDGIEGESHKILGKGEQLNFYGANLTDDEWSLVNA